MGDFDFTRKPSPREVDRYLRSRGIEPRVGRADLDPSAVRLREGYHAPADEARADRIVREHGHHLKPVLVVRDNGYELVDGVHRTRAAELIGQSVPALVIDTETIEALRENDWGGEWAHDWAHWRYYE
jgi:ParB-like chromosome segregation protein Spo0J